MKTVARFTALLTATASLALAQYAPNSIGGNLFVVSITSGTYPLSSSGTLTEFYSSNGSFYDLAATGDVTASSGEYVYTKTGTNSATVTQKITGFPDVTGTITFTSAVGGTFVDRLAGSLAQSSGTFTLIASLVPPLVNISTRAVIGSGQILTPGFVIGGTVPRQVLIRAIGPGLTQFGVSGVMPAPQLTVYRGQTVIASNSGWGGVKAIADAAAAAGGFGIDANSKDSALLLTLDPGSYTAQVSGTPGGDVLVEVYFVN